MKKLTNISLAILVILTMAFIFGCLAYNIMHPELTQFQVFGKFFKLFI